MWLVAAVATVGWAARAAQAHDLRCEKQADGQSIETVISYPKNVHYTIEIRNVKPTDPSVALDVMDDPLEKLGWSFQPAPPFTLGVDESTTDSFDLAIASFEDCQRLAGSDATDEVKLDNTATVTFDTGSAQCSARVVCLAPPPCTGEGCQPPPPSASGVTRTMGFYKTHEQALQACLDQGAIDLGYITISTLPKALGMLWGSPVRFGDHTLRNPLDKDRFLLARQTLVGICNQRLFGTAPTPGTLLTDAVAALAGTDCSAITTLEAQVDAYNNSGDSASFPSGFDAGAATPTDARNQAQDPTSPSGQVCK